MQWVKSVSAFEVCQSLVGSLLAHVNDATVKTRDEVIGIDFYGFPEVSFRGVEVVPLHADDAQADVEGCVPGQFLDAVSEDALG